MADVRFCCTELRKGEVSRSIRIVRSDEFTVNGRYETSQSDGLNDSNCFIIDNYIHTFIENEKTKTTVRKEIATGHAHKTEKREREERRSIRCRRKRARERTRNSREACRASSSDLDLPFRSLSGRIGMMIDDRSTSISNRMNICLKSSSSSPFSSHLHLHLHLHSL